MEENKQITESKITYSEIMKAVDKLPEEEKDTILKFLKVEEIKYVLCSKERTEDYSKRLLEAATFYVTMTNIVQKLSNYICNPDNEVEAVMTTYNGLDDAEKKEVAFNLLCQNEFLSNAREFIQDGFSKWTHIKPEIKETTDGLLKLTESCVRLMKWHHLIDTAKTKEVDK